MVKFVVERSFKTGLFTENQLQKKFGKAVHRCHFFTTHKSKANHKGLRGIIRTLLNIYGRAFLFKRLITFNYEIFKSNL